MGERKIREKMMFFFIWFRRENSKDRKQIFILPIWEKNWEEKKENEGLALELQIYPLQVDVLYVGFSPFILFSNFIIGSCV